MKLKFRAELKDIIIFIIFCLVLLYLVAIGVLNIFAFIKTSSFYGFNPFPAFTGDFLAPTMVFYIAALIAVISSVSSYFFDREKGFGITTSAKKEKGYSQWANEKDMKKDLKAVNPVSDHSDAAGIPLINNEKSGLWVDNGEYHSLIIGSTGSGKTQMMVLPLVQILAKKGESMIVTDPKGEIYEATANMLRDRGYNIVLLNFRDPQKGNAWNPLNLPYSLYQEGNSDKANELLDDLAVNILYDEKAQNQDPFWEKTAADYFAGLSLALFQDAEKDEINLNTINLMTTVGEEKLGPSTYIKEYFNEKDKSSPAYINVSSTIMAPNETKGSILSVFKQKIKLFSSRENLSEMLSYSDFDMKSIGRQKTAVFIVIQDEKKTYHSLVTIFIKQCYETLIDVAQECGGKLPYRTNFILDEFANMPPLKDVTTMVTAARSRNIRFDFIIQNFAQLYQVYGKENGETIKGNCGNIVYLISSELSALEEISKMCGEVKSKEKDKTASTPLVTVSDLQRLKKWEMIVLRTRTMPFKTKMKPYYQMNFGATFEKASYPQREKKSIALFDLKAFVEKQREEKMKQMFSGMENGMPTPGFPNFPPTIPGMPPMPNPGMPSMNPPMGKGFNMDDLMKRIDSAIAQLEEEERQEKEAQKEPVKEAAIEKTTEEKKEQPQEEKVEKPVLEQISTVNMTPMNGITPLSNHPVTEESTVHHLLEELPKMDSIKIVPSKQVESKEEQPKKNNKTITDDQFFDDFFSDDED